MIKFTKEFVENQKKLVEKLPRHTKFEYIYVRGTELIAIGDVDPETNSANASPLLFVKHKEDAKPVRDCILNYYDALEEIEILQKKVSDLEAALVYTVGEWKKDVEVHNE